MNIHEYEIGLHKNELDTPSLLLDLDVVEQNLRTMANHARQAGVNLRPHAKIYKGTPVFAWMQLRAGASGITVSKLSEAEVLAAGGIRDILIANQVVGSRKVMRLVNLAAETQVKVAVDSLENVTEISSVAVKRGVRVGVLVEVNIGNDRCGVEPYDTALQFTKKVIEFPGVEFKGLMGYDGHLVFVKDLKERDSRSRQAYKILVETRDLLVNSGIPVEIVSGSGSATYKSACAVKGITELQVGSYLFMDTAYRDNGGLEEFLCSLSILATVISRPDRPNAKDLAILDIGRKGIDNTLGFPEVKSPGGEVFSMPQEHSRLRFDPQKVNLRVGDKVELWVRDANGTVNLYDRIYGMRGDIVESVWDILGRGQVT
jgi:D-serine deaminase-like pyridoxal phosphate-dependent protein